MEKKLSPNDLESVKRKSRLFEDFTEEESEVGVTGSVKGRKPKLCKIGKETDGTTASQAQRLMHQFASTVTELCTGFETSKKKNEELGRQVTDLEGQIQKWKDQKASWDETKKELEREREEARKEALRAVGEKRDMEEKMEKAAKASVKKSICEAVTSVTRCYKNCLDNLVASLANGEGESLKAYAKELVKEILCDDRALADEAVHVAGHAGSAMKGGKSQSEAAKPGSRSAVYKRGNPVKSRKTNGNASKGEEKKDSPGKKVVKGKEKPKVEKLKPSDDELRKAIYEVLKEADFNTATFNDLLNQLVERFKTDLIPRKASIHKLMIEELTKLADEADDEEDEEAEAVKDDKPASATGVKV